MRTIISSWIPLLVVVYVTVFPFDIQVVVITFLTYILRPALLPLSIVATNRNRIKLINVYFYAVYRPNVLRFLLAREHGVFRDRARYEKTRVVYNAEIAFGL